MRRFVAAVFGVLVTACQGQPPSLKPPPVRSTLNQILETVNHYPPSADTKAAVEGIRKSATWLAARLNDDRTPAAYGRNMAQDVALLQNTLYGSPAQQAQTLEDVLEDIKLKHADCKQFGMGRLVKLEVRTVKDGREVSGWQVFYRWLPARAVGEIRPQPFLALSSPTSVEIPPGAYSVQAKKAVEGKEVASAELPVPVGGKKIVTLEIPVL
jgi:hypothetical protein